MRQCATHFIYYIFLYFSSILYIFNSYFWKIRTEKVATKNKILSNWIGATETFHFMTAKLWAMKTTMTTPTINGDGIHKLEWGVQYTINSCTVFVCLRSHWKWLITTKIRYPYIAILKKETSIEKSLYRFWFVDDWQWQSRLSSPHTMVYQFNYIMRSDNCKIEISYNSPNTSKQAYSLKNTWARAVNMHPIYTNDEISATISFQAIVFWLKWIVMCLLLNLLCCLFSCMTHWKMYVCWFKGA